MSEEEQWERVNSNTTRLRVPGGWLYQVRCVIDNKDHYSTKHMSVVFVPQYIR